MAVTVETGPDSTARALSAPRVVLGAMTSTRHTHAGQMWISVFLDTLVLSTGQVLAEGIYGPEHLLEALARHQLRALGDATELLDGSVDSLDVMPATPPTHAGPS